MKQFFILIVFIQLYTISFAQEKPDLPLPPGSTWVKDSLFIDKTEIANIHWLEYLHYIKRDSSLEYYKKALPDTSLWNKLDTSRVYSSTYLRHPGYSQYPVVGISYEQALNYCKWRSIVVNQTFASKNPQAQSLLEQGKKIEIRYRLPTEKEWELAASAGLNTLQYPFGYTAYTGKPDIKLTAEQAYLRMADPLISEKEFKKKFKKFLKSDTVTTFNCVRAFEDLFVYSHSFPLPINAGLPNQLGLYHMIGNVAEMIDEKGVAKGGSFVHPLEDCIIQQEQKYTEPKIWLGFRCVCEVRIVDVDK